jgi:hypothetical protein
MQLVRKTENGILDPLPVTVINKLIELDLG